MLYFRALVYSLQIEGRLAGRIIPTKGYYLSELVSEKWDVTLPSEVSETILSYDTLIAGTFQRTLVLWQHRRIGLFELR